MRTGIIPMLAGLALIAACDTTVDGESAMVAADSARVAAIAADIAGDKIAMAELMQQAHAKGTFDDAFALAMQDSALAREVFSTVKDDPRMKRETIVESTPSAVAPKRSGSVARRAKSTRSSSPAVARNERNDPLDRAEETSKTVNERLDQAERVKQQVGDAKRKIEGLFQ